MVKNLRTLRSESGLSQQRLAELLGISQQSVNQYENSPVEPDIATLIAIADVFDVSVDYLIGRTSERVSAPPDAVDAKPITGYRRLNAVERDYADAMINAYVDRKRAAKQ